MLNAMVILFLFSLVYRVSGYWSAVVTSLLYATSPHIINLNTLALTESLTITLLILFLFTLRHALRTHNGYPYKSDPRRDEISASLDATLKELVRRFREEPGRHLSWFLWGKPVMLWQWELVQGGREIFPYRVLADPWQDSLLHRLSLNLHRLLHWPLVMVAFLGALMAWMPVVARRWFSFLNHPTDLVFLRVISLLLIYTTLVHLLGIPLPRYHIPVLPALFLMAVTTLRGFGSALRVTRPETPR
jgi:hypothetical protein